MNTDLKITELIETIDANAYVSGQNGQMSSKAHTYLRFREVEGLYVRSRCAAYLIDHILIIILPIMLWYNHNTLEYFLFCYVSVKILYFSILEVSFQSSFGKLLFNSVVADEYGRKPTIKAILIRSITRFFPMTLLNFFGYNLHEKLTSTLLLTKIELKELLELKAKNVLGKENLDKYYKSNTVSQFQALDEKEKLPKGVTT